MLKCAKLTVLFFYPLNKEWFLFIHSVYSFCPYWCLMQDVEIIRIYLEMEDKSKLTLHRIYNIYSMWCEMMRYKIRNTNLYLHEYKVPILNQTWK